MTHHSLSPALLPCSVLYTITQLLSPANPLKAAGNVFSWDRSPGKPFWQMACAKVQPLCPLSPLILKVWNVHSFYAISNKMSKPNLRMSHFLRSKMHQVKANCIWKKICNVSRLHSLPRYNQMKKKKLRYFSTQSSHRRV